VDTAGAASAYRKAWYADPAGVVEQGIGTGVPQERGRSGRLHAKSWLKANQLNRLAYGRVAVCRPWERIASGGVVPPNEGNEVRREGRSEVAALS